MANGHGWAYSYRRILALQIGVRLRSGAIVVFQRPQSMDRDSAIAFMHANRPMPPEAELTDADAQTFDEIRQHFIANPNPVCIPLFLNAFGDGMRLGVYQFCDDEFRCYEQSELTPHIVAARRSPVACTRWWAANWAMDFPDPEMLDALRVVESSSEDSDAHYFAIAALGDIWHATRSADVKHILEDRQSRETDLELIELCDDILNL